MALTVLTPASTRRLTTMEAVEGQMGEQSIGDIDAMIDRASASIERYCKRIFAQQRYQEILYRMRGPWLFLGMVPIQIVQSITLNGEAVTDYRVENAQSGVLYRHAGWWCAAEEEYTIQYVAGYILPEQTAPVVPTGELLPGDVEQAAIEAVKVWWNERDPAGSGRIASRQIGDERVSYVVSAGRSGLPTMSQKILLDGSWRRLVVR